MFATLKSFPGWPARLPRHLPESSYNYGMLKRLKVRLYEALDGDAHEHSLTVKTDEKLQAVHRSAKFSFPTSDIGQMLSEIERPATISSAQTRNT
jgi:hypothetical protein